MGIFLLVVGLILFVGLVVVHELGHFLVARRNGVEAEEFGIGFPPRLWARKMGKGKKKFEFSLNLLPIGGFVKLKGEHDSDTEPGSFGAASFKTKAKIMLAGVGVNLAVALAMLTILAWLGMPRLVDNQFSIKSDAKVVRSAVLVGYVEPDSPAAKIGLKVNDKLIAYGDANCRAKSGVCQSFKTSGDLLQATSMHQGQRLKIEYERKGRIYFGTAQLRSDKEVTTSQKSGQPKGHLGVSPVPYTLTRSTWSAPIVAVGTATQFTALTFQGLGHVVSSLFQGHAAQAGEQVSGPVGIFVVLKAGSLLGYQFMLLIIAVISLTLAIMNVLPIPALDGGRLYLMAFSRLLKKPLTQRVEETIYGASYVFLIGLIVLITIVDVKRYF